MAKPKVCYISPLSIHSCRWIEAFAERSYDTVLITDSKTWIAPTPKSTEVFALPTLDKQNFAERLIPNLLNVIRLLKKIKPDIVNLHVQHHYSPAIFFSRYPYVLTSWGLDVLELPNADFPTQTLAKMTAILARKIVVDAECLRQIWMSLGVSKNKIELIPFGVDTNLFRPRNNVSFIREKLRIKQSDVVVISTRHLFNDHYNIECLIKAIPFVVKYHEDIKFILKGTGPLEAHLKQLVEKLKVSGYVRFVGLTPYEEIALYLAASDIYVSTCFVDSTSVSLLEAMACGLAPIVTDISGNREWIEDERNGLLFPPKDYVTLAEKITQLVENKSERKLYGERCCQIVRQKAEWRKCVEKMESVYKNIL